jgi:hypothetical protein
MTRQHEFQVADTSHLRRPVLCVQVDTEESFDWAGPFSRQHTDTSAIANLPLGHDLFRNFGVRPAYLIDYPVACDKRAVDMLACWAERGECVIGAHLHPWVNPPFEEVVCPQNSFPCNLPISLERHKLAELTRVIHDGFGQSPRLYRAGRYGLDIEREDMLGDLGYQVDTSVMPLRDYSGLGGGPNFFGFPDQPFWTGSQGRLLFVPSTHAAIGPLTGLAYAGGIGIVYQRALRCVGLGGFLSRTGLLEGIMLSPEGVSGSDVKRLVRALLQRGKRVFSFSLHSPSFTPGCTPYVRDAADLKAFLSRIDSFLNFFFGELGGEATDPLALRDLLAPAAGLPEAATLLSV